MTSGWLGRTFRIQPGRTWRALRPSVASRRWLLEAAAGRRKAAWSVSMGWHAATTPPRLPPLLWLGRRASACAAPFSLSPLCPPSSFPLCCGARGWPWGHWGQRQFHRMVDPRWRRRGRLARRRVACRRSCRRSSSSSCACHRCLRRRRRRPAAPSRGGKERRRVGRRRSGKLKRESAKS